MQITSVARELNHAGWAITSSCLRKWVKRGDIPSYHNGHCLEIGAHAFKRLLCGHYETTSGIIKLKRRAR